MYIMQVNSKATIRQQKVKGSLSRNSIQKQKGIQYSGYSILKGKKVTSKSSEY